MIAKPAAANRQQAQAQGPRASGGRRLPYRLLGLAAGALVWELAGRMADPLTFAPFSAVVRALARLSMTADFWSAIGTSLQTLVLGYLAAALFGVALGLLMAVSPKFSVFLDTYMSILITVPMAAVIPLVVIGLGIGTAARAFVVFLFAAPIVAINTAAGVRGVSRMLLEMARAFGAGRGLTIIRVVLPGSMPAVMTGLRLGLGRALVGMISSELVLMAAGVGKLVDKYSSTFQTVNLWALLLVLLLLGAVALGLVQALEARLIHWRPAAPGRRRKGATP